MNPGDGIQGLENHGGLQHHHHGGIGLKMAVQQISGHIQIPVQQQKADVRVRICHPLQNLRLAVPTGLQKLVAGGAAAEKVRIHIHRFIPKADKHRLIIIRPGKFLVQIIIDASVECRAVTVLPIAAINAPDNAVIGYGLGILDGI